MALAAVQEQGAVVVVRRDTLGRLAGVGWRERRVGSMVFVPSGWLWVLGSMASDGFFEEQLETIQTSLDVAVLGHLAVASKSWLGDSVPVGGQHLVRGIGAHMVAAGAGTAHWVDVVAANFSPPACETGRYDARATTTASTSTSTPRRLRGGPWRGRRAWLRGVGHVHATPWLRPEMAHEGCATRSSRIRDQERGGESAVALGWIGMLWNGAAYRGLVRMACNDRTRCFWAFGMLLLGPFACFPQSSPGYVLNASWRKDYRRPDVIGEMLGPARRRRTEQICRRCICNDKAHAYGFGRWGKPRAALACGGAAALECTWQDVRLDSLFPPPCALDMCVCMPPQHVTSTWLWRRQGQGQGQTGQTAGDGQACCGALCSL